MIVSRRTFLLRSAALLPCAGVSRPGWAAAYPGPIRMINGVAASGLDFVLRNSAQGHKYQVETLPGGLGVIDFDNYSWPDIFCVNGAALPSMIKTGPRYWNRLYKNNRDGTFTDVTVKAGVIGSGYGMGVAVGDYNNDGYNYRSWSESMESALSQQRQRNLFRRYRASWAEPGPNSETVVDCGGSAGRYVLLTAT
jgi:hypothetical protein